MSFKETDFPLLIKFLKTFMAKETDPILIRDVLQQLIKMYEDVPLYPGIVSMCLNTAVKEASPQDLTIGQKIYVRNREDCYHGTVVAKDADGVTIKGVKSVTSEDELEIGFKEMERVSFINEKVFEEIWPSLVFDKGKRK